MEKHSALFITFTVVWLAMGTSPVAYAEAPKNGCNPGLVHNGNIPKEVGKPFWDCKWINARELRDCEQFGGTSLLEGKGFFSGRSENGPSSKIVRCEFCNIYVKVDFPFSKIPSCYITNNKRRAEISR